MGRIGVSQEQVAEVANRIADTEGVGAVSLRRVRRELGAGSLQTIHRHLAAWRAVADLREAAVAQPLPAHIPVRFIDPAAAVDMSKTSLIRTLEEPGRGGLFRYAKEVKCPGGRPPDGVVTIRPPDFERIANVLGFPFAGGVWLEYKRTDYKGEKEFDKHNLGYAVEANHGEHINLVSDELSKRSGPYSDNDIRDVSKAILRARAEICIQLDRDLYDMLMTCPDPVRFLSEKIEEAIRGR